MKKEKYYNKLTCVGLTHDGQGICKENSQPIFVFNLLENEIVDINITKATSSFSHGQVRNYHQLSNDRIKPICSLYGVCGGCDIMHMNYQKQLSFKKNMIIETLKRIGKIAEPTVNNIIGMENPYYYRNKVQVPFQSINNSIQYGFYKRKSHTIVPFETCYIQKNESTEIIKYVKWLMEQYCISAYNEQEHTGAIRHVLIRNTTAGEYMVVIVTTKEYPKQLKRMAFELASHFPFIKSIIHNINDRKTNVILGDVARTLYGTTTLIETVCDLNFQMGYKSFFQVNPVQTNKLYELVLQYANLDDTMTVVDAYCGVGTIALLAAQYAKNVIGIEVVEEAINDARINQEINGIENVRFIVGKAEEIIKDVKEFVDCVIIDPPRKGCEKQFLDALLEKKIKKIVYVSCNIATFARDADYLSSNYQYIFTTAVDMFPHSSEVESVSLLVLKE